MKGYRTPSWFRMKGVLARKAKGGKGKPAPTRRGPKGKKNR